MTREEFDNLKPGDIININNGIEYIFDYCEGDKAYFHWYMRKTNFMQETWFHNNFIIQEGKMKTLKEKYLVPGNIVKTKNNYYYLVLNDKVLLGKDGYIYTADYKNDLTGADEYNFENWDIEKVWSIGNWGEGFASVNKIEEFERLGQHGVELLWSREEKIEMTVEELEKKLGLSSGTLRIKK